MRLSTGRRGILLALGAAALFGFSTPFAKLLLGGLPPVLLAGLLYLGSGAGLTLLRSARGRHWTASAPIARSDMPWLAGAVFFGGMVGPVLLMVGLLRTQGSAAALLLNLEGVFTALLAWFVFRENVDRRIALGMGLIVAGSAVLSWQGGEGLALQSGALAVAGACLCWAIDNNLTQKVSAADPMLVASVKGWVAGAANVTLGLVLHSNVSSVGAVAAALMVGFVGYGLSLTLFVAALRQLGTARTAAYFSLAPFLGASASLVILHETATRSLLAAGMLMGAGAWLHLTESHEHEHAHQPLAHSHSHSHGVHHQHEHDTSAVGSEPHTHWHVHTPLVHKHPHYPDIHHRHSH